VLPGIIGTLQALEAIKVILGIGDPLVGRLSLFDSLGMRFREVKLRRDPKCPLCGDNPVITSLAGAGQPVAACAVAAPSPADNG
jgi:hypothetical protein